MKYRQQLLNYKGRLENKLREVNSLLESMEHPKLQAALEHDLAPLGSETDVFFDLERMYDTLLRGGSKTRDFLILKALLEDDT